jgi:hypothetical protein
MRLICMGPMQPREMTMSRTPLLAAALSGAVCLSPAVQATPAAVPTLLPLAQQGQPAPLLAQGGAGGGPGQRRGGPGQRVGGPGFGQGPGGSGFGSGPGQGRGGPGAGRGGGPAATLPGQGPGGSWDDVLVRGGPGRGPSRTVPPIWDRNDWDRWYPTPRSWDRYDWDRSDRGHFRGRGPGGRGRGPGYGPGPFGPSWGPGFPGYGR